MRRIGLAAIAAALVMTACGGGADSPTSDTAAEAPSSPAVTIEAIAFDPAELEVSVGDTVTWTNQDEGVKHTVTSGKPGDKGVPGLGNEKPDKPDGLFDGSLADAGDTFEFTFDEAGTYNYFCEVHPVMTAVVVVGN